MKKILTALLILATVGSLFACDNGGDAEPSYTLTGTIGSIKSDGFMMTVTEGELAGIPYFVKTSDKTDIRYEAKPLDKSKLVVGCRINVIYNGMETRSIPPQITASEIVVISIPSSDIGSETQSPSTKSIGAQSEEFTMKATVVEVMDGAISVEVTESEYAYGRYTVHISDMTVIESEVGLSSGNSVVIVYGGQVTLSLPPQATAIKITVTE